MSVLVTGSIAYDNIAVFHDEFAKHILPEKIHNLNVSFLVPTMKREFGGCAGNIAYNLKLIGGDLTLVGSVGKDATDYLKYFEFHGIDTSFIRIDDELVTANGMIITDAKDNQITAFHPGAMSNSDKVDLTKIPVPKIGIISPNGKSAMIMYADYMFQNGVKTIFDPGQAIIQFNKQELIGCMARSNILICNDYEWSVVQQISEQTPENLIGAFEYVIVTLGEKGSVIYSKDSEVTVPATILGELIDPTGCGDAFRAGLLYGLQNNEDIVKSAHYGSIVAGIKALSKGGQSHDVNINIVNDIMAHRYGI